MNQAIKEQRFAAALIKGATMYDAARAAGHSERGASQAATRLMERQSVKDLLAAYHKRCADQVAIDLETLRRSAFELATASRADCFDSQWKVLPKEDMPEAARELVLNARVWDSPEGKGSAVKLLSKLDAIKGYVKLFPAPPTMADSLEDAAASAMEELGELMARLEPPDDDGEGAQP